MRVGLFTYHAEFATAEYFARAITREGHELVRLGLPHPASGEDVAPRFETLLGGRDLDLLLFVDPPGPIWPIGWEKMKWPIAGYLIDVHQSLDIRRNYAPFLDHVFIAQEDYLDDFRAHGFADAEWLPLACDPEVHGAAGAERDLDVGFIGKLGNKGTARHQVLRAILARYRSNDYERYYPPREMGRLYGRCKIVLNRSINGDLNMRVFEAMAAGALLVTDRIQNGLTTLFEEGRHYVSYSSVEEAFERIDFYLAHDGERCEIAEAGRRLVSTEHTYERRWQRIRQVATVPMERSAMVRKLYGPDLGAAYARVYESLRSPGGVYRVAAEYGFGPRLLLAFARAGARALNAAVPLSPGAIKARLGQ